VFSHQNPVCTSTHRHTFYMHCPFQSSLFDNPNYIWWGVQSIKPIVTSSVPISCYVFCLRPKYPPQHPILENPQSAFFLNVSDQVLHPYNTRQNCILYILIFTFLDSKLEDHGFCTRWYQAFPNFSLLVISSRMEFWFVGLFSSTVLLSFPKNCNFEYRVVTLIWTGVLRQAYRVLSVLYAASVVSGGRKLPNRLRIFSDAGSKRQKTVASVCARVIDVECVLSVCVLENYFVSSVRNIRLFLWWFVVYTVVRETWNSSTCRMETEYNVKVVQQWKWRTCR
jgi:hypothetical protein